MRCLRINVGKPNDKRWFLEIIHTQTVLDLVCSELRSQY